MKRKSAFLTSALPGLSKVLCSILTVSLFVLSIVPARGAPPDEPNTCGKIKQVHEGVSAKIRRGVGACDEFEKMQRDVRRTLQGCSETTSIEYLELATLAARLRSMVGCAQAKKIPSESGQKPEDKIPKDNKKERDPSKSNPVDNSAKKSKDELNRETAQQVHAARLTMQAACHAEPSSCNGQKLQDLVALDIHSAIFYYLMLEPSSPDYRQARTNLLSVLVEAKEVSRDDLAAIINPLMKAVEGGRAQIEEVQAMTRLATSWADPKLHAALRTTLARLGKEYAGNPDFEAFKAAVGNPNLDRETFVRLLGDMQLALLIRVAGGVDAILGPPGDTNARGELLVLHTQRGVAGSGCTGDNIFLRTIDAWMPSLAPGRVRPTRRVENLPGWRTAIVEVLTQNTACTRLQSQPEIANVLCGEDLYQGVMTIDININGGYAQVRAEVHWLDRARDVMAPQAAAEVTLPLCAISGDNMAQKQAAFSLLETLSHDTEVLRPAPASSALGLQNLAKKPISPPASPFHAFALAGLPNLLDKDPVNDRRGRTFLYVDLGLTVSGLLFLGSKDAGDPTQTRVEAFSATSGALLVGAITMRVINFIQYRRYAKKTRAPT